MGKHSAPTGRRRPTAPVLTPADLIPTPAAPEPLTDEFPMVVQFVDNEVQFVPEDVYAPRPTQRGPGFGSATLVGVVAAGLIVSPSTGDQPAQAAEPRRSVAEEILGDLRPVSTIDATTRLAQLSASRVARDAELTHAADVQAAADRAEIERREAGAARLAAEEAARRAASEARAAAERIQEAAEEASRHTDTPRASPASPGSTAAGQLVAGARLTSGVGPRWGAQHAGIDLAAPLGTPIHAAASGRVLMAGAASGYGNWVVVLTDDGFVNIYGHMRTYYVSAGERVAAGQVIALVGNQGQSTGPHLHFEVHSGGSVNGPVVDPEVWLPARAIRV